MSATPQAPSHKEHDQRRLASQANGAPPSFFKLSAEEGLRKSEALFAAFMEYFLGFAWMKDLDGRFLEQMLQQVRQISSAPGRGTEIYALFPISSELDRTESL